jgi:two-component system, OmpR family, sensor histidine kinase MtrB
MPGQMGNIFRYGAEGTQAGSVERTHRESREPIPNNQETSGMERRAQWDNLTKGQLAETLGTISHELRTPLAAMKVTLKVVLDQDAGPVNEDQKRFLAMTMRNIDRLDRLVGDLLDISRAEAARSEIDAQRIDLRQLFEDVAVAHGPTSRQSGINLLVYPPRPGFRVWADPDKFMQVISNVLSNALKYTPEGGLVQMLVEESGPGIAKGHFVLIIKDNGRGMSASQVKSMFEPYVRCHDEQTTDIPGTGLGLHITKGLVEAHGGTIDVGSAPGIGTEVRITLPVNGPEKSTQG